MKRKTVAIVGAAETTELGILPGMSQIMLHADAALNAMADAGLKPADIDGVATAGETPTSVAHYLGITPKWVDGTAVGGCSFMLHVRHAAAAINEGLCRTVLITHGESGKSRVGVTPWAQPPRGSLPGQFEIPLRTARAADPLHHPGAALPQDLRRDAGAACHGRGGAARMGGEEPARHLPRPDHRRRRPRLAHDRLSVPPPHVLPRHRRRRRAHPDGGGAGARLSAQARLHPRHRRERRDADGEPNGGLHLVARLPRLGRPGLR